MRAVAAVVAAVAMLWGASVEGAKSRGPRRANVRTGMAPTPYEALARAVKRNDRGAIERIGARLGAARLFEGLHHANPAVVVAVLSTIPRVRGGISLVGSVADLTVSPDVTVSAAAARAVGSLLDGDVPAAAEEWEVPPDTLSHACGALQALALRPDAAPAVRLVAVEAAAEASPTCGGNEDLASLLKDPTPSVRRAAALALLPTGPRVTAALREASRDRDPGVAAAAVAVLCRNATAPPTQRRTREPLAADTIELARTLIVAPGTPTDDAVEMVSCLLVAGTAADRRVLDQLRRGPPSQLRDTVTELADAADAPKSP